MSAASRCIRLVSGLSSFSGLPGVSGVSRLSQQNVCRAATLPRLESRPLLQRLGPSLLNASSVALYSTGKDGSEGSKTTSFTSAPSSGSGLADQILSSKVQAENAAGDGSKTGAGGEEKDGGKSGDEKEEERRKEASWRAMKLSFGLFGVMCAGFGGWTIAVFGEWCDQTRAIGGLGRFCWKLTFLLLISALFVSLISLYVSSLL